jgi:hypothetical protein
MKTTSKLVCIAAALLVMSAGWAPASGATKKKPPPDTYRQPLFFEWDHNDLDVLIVPPGHGQLVNGPSNDRLLNDGDPNEVNPLATSYLKATLKSITDWQRAIQAFGSASLKRLKLNVYVLGRDVPSSSALNDPDVLIVFDETKGTTAGITYSPDAVTLDGQPVNSPCTIANSMWLVSSFSYSDMYNVAGHEFGHCLGVNHTTSSGSDTVIKRDIMFYKQAEPIGNPKTSLNCMSNLNVNGIGLAFDGKPAPTEAAVLSTKYKKISC